MRYPSDSSSAATHPHDGADAALAVLSCARSLSEASQHVRARLRDDGARARLGRLGDRCAGALGTLERVLEGAGLPAAIGTCRIAHGLRSGIHVGGAGGAGADLCLLLELDVLAARLQARIEGLLARGPSPALRDTLRTLSALVREIRAEYELYVA